MGVIAVIMRVMVLMFCSSMMDLLLQRIAQRS